MPVPKDPEKRKLWIERQRIAQKGRKNPALAERNRQQTGEKNHMFGVKGKNHPSFGKKRPDLAEWNRQHKKGKKNPIRAELNRQQKGKDHPNYGKRKENPVTPIYKLVRKCSKYNEWRLMIFGRDNFTCQRCYKKGVYLHAHHKKLFSIILKENNIITIEQAENCKELWNINNGITYCKKCHEIIHRLLEEVNK